MCVCVCVCVYVDCRMCRVYMNSNITFRSAFLHELVVLVVLLFYVHGKHLRSCRDGQLT